MPTDEEKKRQKAREKAFAMLLEVYGKKQRLERLKQNSIFSTNFSIEGGANSHKEDVLTANAIYKTENTKRQFQQQMDLIRDAFDKMEGYKTKFYKPSDKSGWTIGHGIDISQMTEEQVRQLGMPEKAINFAKKYKAFGRTDVQLPNRLPDFSKEAGWDLFVHNVLSKNVEEFSKVKAQNPNLSDEAAAVFVSYNHWAGDALAKDVPSFTPYKTHVRLGENKYGKNPIRELYMKGELTDESMAGAFKDLYQGMDPNWQNARTMERYYSRVTTGDWDGRPFSMFASTK